MLAINCRDLALTNVDLQAAIDRGISVVEITLLE